MNVKKPSVKETTLLSIKFISCRIPMNVMCMCGRIQPYFQPSFSSKESIPKGTPLGIGNVTSLSVGVQVFFHHQNVHTRLESDIMQVETFSTIFQASVNIKILKGKLLFVYNIVNAQSQSFTAEESSQRSDLVNAVLFSHGILLFNRCYKQVCILYLWNSSYFYFNVTYKHFYFS